MAARTSAARMQGTRNLAVPAAITMEVERKQCRPYGRLTFSSRPMEQLATRLADLEFVYIRRRLAGQKRNESLEMALLPSMDRVFHSSSLARLVPHRSWRRRRVDVTSLPIVHGSNQSQPAERIAWSYLLRR